MMATGDGVSLSKNTSSRATTKQQKIVFRSAWEEWLIKKEVVHRRERCKQKLEKSNLVEEQTKEYEKKKQEYQNRQAKATEIMNQRRMEEKKKQAEKQKKEQELNSKKVSESVTKEKLKKQRVKEWRMKQTVKESEMKQKEQQLLEEKLQAMHLRKEKSTDAYVKWLTQNRGRSKRIHRSSAYINGTEIEYFDRGSVPQPSFVNPKPWVSIVELT